MTQSKLSKLVGTELELFCNFHRYRYRFNSLDFRWQILIQDQWIVELDFVINENEILLLFSSEIFKDITPFTKVPCELFAQRIHELMMGDKLLFENDNLMLHRKTSLPTGHLSKLKSLFIINLADFMNMSSFLREQTLLRIDEYSKDILN